MTPLLLDTCAAIWLAEKEPISQAAIDALNQAVDMDEPVYVSMITGWEIGLLVAKKRLPLSMEPLAWFERLLATPGVRLANLSARILVASSFLPGRPPNDPMDRVLLATAREGGYRLITRDRRILAYGDDGHVMSLAC